MQKIFSLKLGFIILFILLVLNVVLLNIFVLQSVVLKEKQKSEFVRLFNATDKHPVWFSEVSIKGGTPKLLISNPITLDSGRKLYQVQIKTSLKYQAILDQARVHITTY